MCFHVAPRSSERYRPDPPLAGAADDVEALAVGVHRDRDADAAVVLRQRRHFVHVLPSSVDLNSFAGPAAARSPRGHRQRQTRRPLPSVVANIRARRVVVVPEIAYRCCAGRRRALSPRSCPRRSCDRSRRPHRCCRRRPRAATTRFGSFGSTSILLMRCVSSRPMCVHVLPASMDLYMPSPSPPAIGSPLPT